MTEVQEQGRSWRVMKFGGSSLASPGCFQRVKQILSDALNELPDCTIGEGAPEGAVTQSLAVVTSAMGGDPRTTDLLFQTVRSAANNDVAGYKATLGQIRDRHLGLAEHQRLG